MTEDYRAIANSIAKEIEAGGMKPGEKLLPQREFAYQHGIAASTAGRVYGELRRRGLVSGEVGRGTFVRSAPYSANTALIDVRDMPINLELVFPVLEKHSVQFAASIANFLTSPAWMGALAPVGAIPSRYAKDIAAGFFARKGWNPQPNGILFTGNGKQAIAAALGAVAPPGSRVGVETLTYPVVRSLASQLGIELVPIQIDDQGLSIEALSGVFAHGRLQAIYLQPSVHSPTAATMSIERRVAIAGLLERHDVIAIEDGIYHFLVDELPLAAFAPNHVVFVDSLSKRLAPGLGLGIIVSPERLLKDIANSIRRGVWMPIGLALSIGLHWIASDLLAGFVEDKRRDASVRQRIARKALNAFNPKGDERAYHIWLDLPDHWRAENFAAAALRRGISLTPGSAFAAQTGYAPNGVRIALAAPPLHMLQRALEELAELASSRDAFDLE